MIENIFLAYLNNPISENPDNLDEIIKVIRDFDVQQFDRLHPDIGFPLIEVRPIVLGGFPESVLRYIKKLLQSDYHRSMIENTYITCGQSKDVPRYDIDRYQIAYDAVWGKEDVDVCPGCEHQQSCIICRQQSFVCMVQGIIAGDDFDKLTVYLQWSNECTKTALTVSKNPDGSYFKDGLERVNYFFSPFDPTFQPVPGVNVFNRFIDSIMGFSFCWFLSEPPQKRQKNCDAQPNRFRLRQCSHCDKFYIADRLPAKMSLPPGKTFCSRICKNAFYNPMMDRDKLNEYRRKMYREGKESYYPK